MATCNEPRTRTLIDLVTPLEAMERSRIQAPNIASRELEKVLK